ncbi:MAG: hypothetical protein E7158_00720 [Firmicutes bacterium]|nr:hypothetical protein [Bacillota bacterium]
MFLNTQVSNFDSASTCLCNSLKILYQKDEIPLKLLKIIYSNTLDGKESNIYENGTSRFAMKRICNKFNIYGAKHNMDIFFMYYAKNEVNLEIIKKALTEKRVLIVRNNYENENYFMVINIENDNIWIFDPSIEIDDNDCNVIINIEKFDTTKNLRYSLGPIDTRELIVASKYC